MLDLFTEELPNFPKKWIWGSDNRLWLEKLSWEEKTANIATFGCPPEFR